MEKYFTAIRDQFDGEVVSGWFRLGCGLSAGCLITGMFVKKYIDFKKKCETKKKIKRKQEECQKSKRKLANHLMEMKLPIETRNRIINLSFNNLTNELQSGKLSASDVLLAYQSKAMEIDGEINCITEVIGEAEKIAENKDKDTKVKGALHGIPMSVKECYYVKGYDCTAGIAYFLEQPVEEDNVLLQVLKSQGANPFVRCNLSQTMRSYECSNPIFGTTVNPHDHTRTPGGSSGGDGALIGAGGAILGMGSDIGGSLRIPAHFNGCSSLKPTVGRISCQGQIQFLRGQQLVRGTPGPMSAEVDGCVACMKCLLVPEMFELDPTVPPIPFRSEIYESKRPLTIGYYTDDGNVMPSPSCQRAVLEVKAMLEAQGHTLIPFRPLDIYRAFGLFVKALFADGGRSFISAMKDEPIDPTLRVITRPLFLPIWLRQVAGYIAEWITKDHYMSVFLSGLRGCESVEKYYDLATDIDQYKAEFLKTWKFNKLDAVICPGLAYPATPLGKLGDVMGASTYTSLYNLLNYPAGVVKVTEVTQQDLDDFKLYPSNTWTEKYIREFSEGSLGLPVGVQCVALPYQEELVLRLMKAVETGLKH